MIGEILKEKKPEDKPKFFLHDEVKLWLKDHLRITQSFTPDAMFDYELGTKFQTFSGFIRGLESKISIHIDSELVTETFTTISLDIYRPLKKLSDHIDLRTSQVIYLENKVRDLEKRIEELEKPLDV